MNNELKVPLEDIQREMEDIVIPYAKSIGLYFFEILQITVRYAKERSKDYEWESNERAFNIIKSMIDSYNTPINKFQRKWGRLHVN
jgi:hypothetical protein